MAAMVRDYVQARPADDIDDDPDAGSAPQGTLPPDCKIPVLKPREEWPDAIGDLEDEAARLADLVPVAELGPAVTPIRLNNSIVVYSLEPYGSVWDTRAMIDYLERACHVAASREESELIVGPVPPADKWVMGDTGSDAVRRLFDDYADLLAESAFGGDPAEHRRRAREIADNRRAVLALCLRPWDMAWEIDVTVRLARRLGRAKGVTAEGRFLLVMLTEFLIGGGSRKLALKLWQKQLIATGGLKPFLMIANEIGYAKDYDAEAHDNWASEFEPRHLPAWTPVTAEVMDKIWVRLFSPQLLVV